MKGDVEYTIEELDLGRVIRGGSLLVTLRYVAFDLGESAGRGVVRGISRENELGRKELGDLILSNTGRNGVIKRCIKNVEWEGKSMNAGIKNVYNATRHVRGAYSGGRLENTNDGN